MTTQNEAHEQRLVAVMNAAANVLEDMPKRKRLEHGPQVNHYAREVTIDWVAKELRALIAEVEL